MRQDLRSFQRTRNAPYYVAHEQLSCIEVAAALVESQVEAIEGNRPAILPHLVDGVGPGVGELPGQPVPGIHFEDLLHRVVARGAVTIELQDRTDVRIHRVQGAVLIQVQHYIQLVGVTCHVAELEHHTVTDALLELQAVVVEIRRPEVLVDRVNVKRCCCIRST